MIPSALQGLFGSAQRQRGEEYVRRDLVRVMRAQPERVLAVVKGSVAYAVEIGAEKGQVVLSCTCPYAEEHGICKHLWAVLRVAERDGSLEPLITLAGPAAQYFAIGAHEEEEEEVVEAEAWQPEHVQHRRGAGTPPRAPGTPPPPADWRRVFRAARAEMQHAHHTRAQTKTDRPTTTWPSNRRVVYIVELGIPTGPGGVAISLAAEKLRRDGDWDPPKAYRAPLSVWLSAPDPMDRQLIQMIVGASALGYGGVVDPAQPMRTDGYALAAVSFDTTLRTMCDTGRCRVRLRPGEPPVSIARWDEGPPWRMAVRVSPGDNGDLALSGTLTRGEERLALEPPVAIHPAGLLFIGGTLSRVETVRAFPLVAALYGRTDLTVPKSELPDLLEAAYAMPDVPALELPADTKVSEAHQPPAPCLTISFDGIASRRTFNRVTLSFLYGKTRVVANDRRTTIFDRDSLTVWHRDVTAENEAMTKLHVLGARTEWDYRNGHDILSVPTARVGAMVMALVQAGWHVDADGVQYRAATETMAAVRSGIDWFDLRVAARYGDVEVPLADLLDAEERGAPGVQLPDGTMGILPTEWLAKWKAVAAGGSAAAGGIRFSRAQTSLLDALLAALPEVDIDEAFETARAELRAFDSVQPADAPPGFVGTLREYQREGLGWLKFLMRFGLGGCLADDMGLGKTIQVLALLESRRSEGEAKGPSIVVVPRSLVHNWIAEAARFTPALRVLDYSAGDRREAATDLQSADLVVTTYGVLRREAAAFAAIEFDCAILDEAQAIKNASTASAKAARLIRARHRLAVTGTPIENRLEELWSLFEFLNPGMLGARAGFGRLVRIARSSGATEDQTAAQLMARALRPVILRRTKERVAKELPERTEQTLEVDLEPAQRKFYDSILERYRASLIARVDRMGVAKSRMHILEALLRLRQAACHPQLVDPGKKTLPSAKLDALVPALAEITAEGHKALVFSQFTSFLALVKAALDEAKIPYEYLDGAVRDRQKRVDRFQSDPAVPVFLISLKAGGQGLNLTAADYVYLLDPWWNPAVEAQAIDRTHRIGQTRRVLATRIVARGTIEEKILALQASKRALADAILSEDQGVLSGIGRQELEALLS